MKNKLRTTLTGFAVAWGIFMIIVLLGAGNGLINATLKMSSDFLANSMEVYGGSTSMAYNGLSEGRWIRLNTRDLAATDTEFKEHVDEVGATFSISATVTHGEEYMNMQINGVYPVHTKISKRPLLCGRFINEIDQREQRKVLVLNDKQAKELEPKDFTTLVGKYVKVGNFAFKIVGIYKEQENGRADMFSAYSTIKSIYGSKTDDAGRIEFTFHGLETEAENEAFEKDYRQRINTAHQAHPDDENAIWLWNRYTQ